MSGFDVKGFRKALPHPTNAPQYYGGVPPYKERPGQRGWVDLDWAWLRDNTVLVPIAELPGWPALPGGQTPSGITVNTRIAEFVKASWREVHARGLHERLRTYNGALATRHMGNHPARPLSLHSYGIALDFDAAWNGYGVPPERMQIDREFVEVMERCGWAWGGRWKMPFTDGMHFEATLPAYAHHQEIEPLYNDWPPPPLEPTGEVTPGSDPIPSYRLFSRQSNAQIGSLRGRLVGEDKIYVDTLEVDGNF